MDKHVDLIAWLHIGLGALTLLGGGIAFVAMAGAGLLSGDPGALFVTSAVAAFVGLIVVVTAIPGIIGGVGLLRRAEWARILMLVVAFFELFHVPFGTALAIYTFWALFQDETKWLFRRATA